MNPTQRHNQSAFDPHDDCHGYRIFTEFDDNAFADDEINSENDEADRFLAEVEGRYAYTSDAPPKPWEDEPMVRLGDLEDERGDNDGGSDYLEYAREHAA